MSEFSFEQVDVVPGLVAEAVRLNATGLDVEYKDGCNPDEAAHKVKSALESALQKVGATNTAAAGDLI